MNLPRAHLVNGLIVLNAEFRPSATRLVNLSEHFVVRRTDFAHGLHRILRETASRVGAEERECLLPTQ